MKKSIALILVLAICFCLCACGLLQSNEYKTAVTNAKSWASTFGGYIRVKENSNKNPDNLTLSLTLLGMSSTVSTGLTELFTEDYSSLTEKEQEKFMDWFAAHDYEAYEVFAQYVSTGNISTALS